MRYCLLAVSMILAGFVLLVAFGPGRSQVAQPIRKNLSDFGIVGDVAEVLPALAEAIRTARG